MSKELFYIYDDGGRQAAGFKGTTGDCVTRAIAIVTGKPYKEVYDELNILSNSKKLGKRKEKSSYGTKYVKVSSSRTGIAKKVSDEYLASLGFKWVATMKIGSGCKVHMRESELPKGKIIVRVSKHMAAVIDGVLYDTHDSSREGTRCVYGYYMKDVAELK